MSWFAVNPPRGQIGTTLLHIQLLSHQQRTIFLATMALMPRMRRGDDLS
jgi:hypothetical protein